MTLLVDAAPLIALADRADPQMKSVLEVLTTVPGPIIVPAPVTAEVDYLLGRRLGAGPRQAFLDDLAQGRFVVECLRRREYVLIADLERRYADLQPGLADLSLVVLAQRFVTLDLLTFDERHFRAIRPLQGGAFRLLPADA